MIGSAPFESLVELISHYEKFALYRQTKLKYPCNQEVTIMFFFIIIENLHFVFLQKTFLRYSPFRGLLPNMQNVCLVLFF